MNFCKENAYETNSEREKHPIVANCIYQGLHWKLYGQATFLRYTPQKYSKKNGCISII